MKRRILLFGMLTGLMAGLAFLFFLPDSIGENQRDEAPAVEKGMPQYANDYLSRLRNNQMTGTIDPRDMLKVQEQVTQLKGAGQVDLNWTSLGPENIGGKTRSVIYDNRDQNGKTIIAAGVNGGIYKTTNSGLSWNLIPGTDNLNVTCLTQAADGALFAGTGEGLNAQNYNLLGDMYYTTGFLGSGIYKIDAAGTVTQVEGSQPVANNVTTDFAYINKVAVATDGKIFAAVNTGLKVKSGGTWNFAQYIDTLGNPVQMTGIAYDIEIGSDGVVVAAVNGQGFISLNGDPAAFHCFSTGMEEELPATGIGKMDIAISPTDPGYIYIMAVKATDRSLFNIYLSKDKGTTWEVIGPGGAISFNVLGTGTTFMGDYCGALIVDPVNKERVFAGGIHLWEGNKINASGYFDWSQKTTGNIVHPIHFCYAFKPGTNSEYIIATENGLVKAAIQGGVVSYDDINNGFVTSDFYHVSPYGSKDYLIGGAQGNGTCLIYEFNNKMSARNIWDNDFSDGGYCLASVNYHVSTLNGERTDPPIYYNITTRFTGDVLVDRSRRSETNGDDYAYAYLPEEITGTIYLTPTLLWENFEDENSLATQTFVADRYYAAGEMKMFYSHNYDHPFYHTFTAAVNEGDSVLIKDIITSKLFLATTNGVWMTFDGLRFDMTPVWYKISGNTQGGLTGDPQCMAYSSDANYLFVGTQDGKLYRISNIAYAYDYNTADVRSTNCIIASDLLELIPGGNTQVITSVAVDPANANKVIVTLGNYGNDHYVYYTENALADVPVFTSVQKNLPEMPVYSSLFEMDPSNNLVLVGTEYGVWANDNPASQDWYPVNSNMGYTPVLSLKQQTTWKNDFWVEFEDPGTGEFYYDWYPKVDNYGVIYAATYGKGVFKEETYYNGIIGQTPDKKQVPLIHVYPNPVSGMLNVTCLLTVPSDVMIRVTDLAGRIVLSKEVSNLASGSHEIRLDCSRLNEGVYLVVGSSGPRTGTAKIIISR